MDHEKKLLYSKLKALECPFTWQIPDISPVNDTRDPSDIKLHDDETLPLNKIIKNAMHLFYYVNQKDISKSLELMEEGDDIMQNEKSRNYPEISFDTVVHIFEATKAFAYFHFEMLDNSKEILNKINEKKLCYHPKVISTINGCKSLCWNQLHNYDIEKALKFIKMAKVDNPHFHLWHFYHAKFLRKLRRLIDHRSSPSQEEKDNFLKAYDMEDNAIYGIYVAQMYRESYQNDIASETYEKIFKKNSENVTILLRLALGFIQFKRYDLAKECLDRVKDNPKKRSMYAHYMGIFHFKQNNYEDGMYYFEEAFKSTNFAAEINYLSCKIKLKEPYDITNHLFSMTDKFKNYSKYLQRINLEIAMRYLIIHKKIDEAARFFLKALDFDSRAAILKNFSPQLCEVNKNYRINVFNHVQRDVLPEIYDRFSDEDLLKVADRIKNHCSKYRNNTRVFYRKYPR